MLVLSANNNLFFHKTDMYFAKYLSRLSVLFVLWQPKNTFQFCVKHIYLLMRKMIKTFSNEFLKRMIIFTFLENSLLLFIKKDLIVHLK